MVVSDLGQQLREARLARGLSLEDVQEMTKIRKRYLEAIEAGDYKVLPGSFYVRAFIKTYAEAVGLDADELLAEHRQNVPSTAPEPTMEPVMQKRRSRQHTDRNSKWLSTTLMWSFAVLILIVIYMYFTVWGNNSDKADGDLTDPTPVTEGKAPAGNGNNAGKPGNVAEGDAIGGNNAANGGNGTDTGNAGVDNGTDTGANTNNGNGTNTGTGNTGGDAGEPGIAVVADGEEGNVTKYKIQNAGTDPVQVVITATGESWVEVRKGSKNGEKLQFGKTKDGDVLTYDIAPEGLYIISGNSANTAIAVAGQPITDGKTTSRFLLNLDNGSTGTDSPMGDTGTDAGGNTAGNDSGNTSTDGE
ncbi:helix-turn-helix domain-containing protein [Paenibacillus macerans]|uniref:helix-turn-helix domain-containing protein n=1 Tax=Paenibacillus macerans TaxID=44252 RepID=UPI003D31BEE3